MIREAIILAGGLGTRLRPAVGDLPKCMAPVAGRPFLGHVIDYFREQGIERFIFSLGYKHRVIEDWLQDSYPGLEAASVVEKEPLGTGGAIRLACGEALEETVLVLNGDTLFRIRLEVLAAFHRACGADCTLSLKPMQAFDRYGAVTLNPNGSVQSFREKQFYDRGLINGGVYALQAGAFLKEALPEKFSFEKDYLEAFYDRRPIYGLEQDGYFIDIGIPEDYERAKEEL